MREHTFAVRIVFIESRSLLILIGRKVSDMIKNIGSTHKLCIEHRLFFCIGDTFALSHRSLSISALSTPGSHVSGAAQRQRHPPCLRPAHRNLGCIPDMKRNFHTLFADLPLVCDAYAACFTRVSAVATITKQCTMYFPLQDRSPAILPRYAFWTRCSDWPCSAIC